jgi:hypothetical protein
MDYAKHYAKLIDRARRRPLFRNINYEFHHIVPRCMGGGEERENLVRLKLEEHCVAHLLLAKMHPDNPKVVYAAEVMSRKGSELRMTKNKRYGRATRAGKKRWEYLRGNYMFRAIARKPKRYGAADVDRLRKMLRPIADFA